MHLFLILVVIWVVFSTVQNIRITWQDLAVEVGTKPQVDRDNVAGNATTQQLTEKR